ncbi:MAG: amidohydrolase [Actinobacteria bacterium]|nr:amidohydrolase [Actinomycetota bacterium]
MILENGLIRTMDSSMPVARALAIAADRIAGGVGTHETALATPERVDLGGRCVLPGFSDSHVHFPTWSLAQREVRLEAATSLEDAVGRVGRAAASVPADRWLLGRGWRDSDWHTPAQPTKTALDAVTGPTPVALTSRDGHSLWLNSAGLDRANGDFQLEGGVVEIDDRGQPSGVLREESAWRFRDRHVVISDDEYVEATRAGIKLANARGVTAVHDKDGWVGAPRFWQRLESEGALTLRVWQSLPHERVEELEALGLRSGFGSPLLRLGYLKVFMDGTLGSQTARLLDGSGVEITSREELAAIVRRAARAGWPVAVHAIGDQANRDALDAFEATAADWQPLGLRHRIEHAQLLAAEEVARFATVGVATSVQFSHAPSDRDLADRFWAGKTEGAYAFRALVEAGTLVANGSDAPVEELDPLLGLRAGVLRTLDERPGWRPEQALTMQQALEATTVNPAWLAGDERRRGKLLPGYLADLVVLNRDPLECPPDELGQLEVVATMLAGRWVHNPPPW